MIDKDEVKKLAHLSRLALSKGEVEKLQGEVNSILEYIDTIQKVNLPNESDTSTHLDLENVMREDNAPHESGIYTESLLAQAPQREGNFVKVKTTSTQ